jgi:hypothetical protein
MIYRQVAQFSAYGVGIDLGVNYQLGPGLSLAAHLRDATTTPLVWNTDARDSIRPALFLGAAYQRSLAGGKATLAVGSRTGGSADAASAQTPLHTGIEYRYRSLALRGGLEEGRQSLGIGLQPHARIALDFAYLQHDELESTYQLSANVSF